MNLTESILCSSRKYMYPYPEEGFKRPFLKRKVYAMEFSWGMGGFKL